MTSIAGAPVVVGRPRAAGKTVGDLDLLIGGAAFRHRLTVLTNNRRHFELIEGIQLPTA